MNYVLPFTENTTILELGGGENPLRLQSLKTVNVDIRKVDGVDIVKNLEEDFSDIGQYDGIFSQYLLEHINWRKVPIFLKSCFNVLKPNTYAIFLIPDTEEQMKLVLSKPEWDLGVSQMIFGDQNYNNNTHKVAFNKTLITKLLKDAGFTDVEIDAHPDPNARDMFVRAFKKGEPNKDMYERKYFEGWGTTGSNYRDHQIHHYTACVIAEKYKPDSAIELGGARGYVSKILRDRWNIPSTCIDISKHCYYTRATDDFILMDLTRGSIPREDKQFDLAFSLAFFEHVPEEKIEQVIRESIRVSKRGLHGITFSVSINDVDKTHRFGTMKPKEWWEERFKSVDSTYPVIIVNKETLEDMNQIPVPIDNGGLVKWNMGSFTEMFPYGWVNSDIIDLTDFANKNFYRFMQMDVSKPLPAQNNSVNLMVAHHLLEHLTRSDGEAFLRECLRVLKPEGVIRFSVPDTFKLATKYLNGSINEYAIINEGVEKASDDAEMFFNLSTAGHMTYYDANSLIKLFKKIGFKDIIISTFSKSRSSYIEKETIDSFPELSVYIEAVKGNEVILGSENNGIREASLYVSMSDSMRSYLDSKVEEVSL